jgi:hypothetical protein
MKKELGNFILEIITFVVGVTFGFAVIFLALEILIRLRIL